MSKFQHRAVFKDVGYSGALQKGGNNGPIGKGPQDAVMWSTDGKHAWPPMNSLGFLITDLIHMGAYRGIRSVIIYQITKRLD